MEQVAGVAVVVLLVAVSAAIGGTIIGGLAAALTGTVVGPAGRIGLGLAGMVLAAAVIVLVDLHPTRQALWLMIALETACAALLVGGVRAARRVVLAWRAPANEARGAAAP